MLDSMSAEELWTGVEVRQGSCVRIVRPLPLFGVLGKKLTVDGPTTATSLPDAPVASSVAFIVVRVVLVLPMSSLDQE